MWNYHFLMFHPYLSSFLLAFSESNCRSNGFTLLSLVMDLFSSFLNSMFSINHCTGMINCSFLLHNIILLGSYIVPLLFTSSNFLILTTSLLNSFTLLTISTPLYNFPSTSTSSLKVWIVYTIDYTVSVVNSITLYLSPYLTLLSLSTEMYLSYFFPDFTVLFDGGNYPLLLSDNLLYGSYYYIEIYHALPTHQ